MSSKWEGAGSKGKSILGKGTEDERAPQQEGAWSRLRRAGAAVEGRRIHSTRACELGTVQLSHPYMTNGKTIALTRRNFVGKVMSLLFNTRECVKFSLES